MYYSCSSTKQYSAFSAAAEGQLHSIKVRASVLLKHKSILWYLSAVHIHVHIVCLVWPCCSGLHSCLFFYPATEFSHCCVNARFIPAGTAVTPTDHSCQEHTTAGRTGQRTTRVPLTEDTNRYMYQHQSIAVNCYVWHNVHFQLISLYFFILLCVLLPHPLVFHFSFF